MDEYIQIRKTGKDILRRSSSFVFKSSLFTARNLFAIVCLKDAYLDQIKKLLPSLNEL